MNGTRWGTLGCTLREGFATTAGLALGVWALALALDWASGLLRAYPGAVLRLESERWMLENCRNPVVFAQMRAHTNVCAEVEASAPGPDRRAGGGPARGLGQAVGVRLVGASPRGRRPRRNGLGLRAPGGAGVRRSRAGGAGGLRAPCQFPTRGAEVRGQGRVRTGKLRCLPAYLNRGARLRAMNRVKRSLAMGGGRGGASRPK
jgi:hypothetical protein